MSNYSLRRGKKEDLPRILELIRELAEYEKEAHQVETTVEQMEKDSFGPDPVFYFFVLEDETGFIPGMALYYYRYSTWKGRRLYLEDLVVTESERGKGLGKLLFERVMIEAHDTGCSGMVWQVLDWNEPAINFYKKYDAGFDGEWINCWVDAEQLNEVARKGLG